MPKRSDLVPNLSPSNATLPRVFFLFCVLLVLLAGGAQASTAVRIAALDDVPPGDTIALPVTLDSVTAGLDIVGFDLLITWDPSGLRLLEAEAGQLLNDCSWEYFQYRTDTVTDWHGFPVDYPIVRIVGIADINNGPIHPWCHASSAGELAVLRFETSSHPQYYGWELPVRFLWVDCGDNTMALNDGGLLISERVFDHGVEITDDQPLPTWFGAPSECAAVREIDFYNGRVWLASADSMTESDAAVYIIAEDFGWLGWTVGAEVRISNVAPLFEIGGFDLLLTYDPTGLTFVGATQGDLLSQCGWEYFNFRSSADSGLVRLVALGDINNGDIHPSCWLNQNGTLAQLSFEIVDSPSNAGRELPLRFIWRECGDNAMVDPTGDSLYLSLRTFDEHGYEITADDTMPTFNGAPEGCLSYGSIRRAVDYFSESFRVATSDPQVIDYRGDVNVNMIPYEVADFVVFSNYFAYGLTVFTVDVELQVASTDVNADGLVLTFDDLAYLYRVIVGDAAPIWNKAGPAVDTAVVIQDTTANSLSVSYSGNLTMLFLSFNGAVEVDAPDPHILAVDTTSEGGHTRMLIYPGFENTEGEQLINTGYLMSCTGNGQLVSAQAAYNGIDPVPAMVQIGQGTPCCIVRGNIDHDSTGTLDISDLVYVVTYMFDGGPPPPCPDEADVNGNGVGVADIADLVYLIDYMFNFGPAPAPCP